jgi:ribosomal protein S12 methylthiotransferase accessory factor YcaO
MKALACKLILLMSISQFSASDEKLTGLASGPTYKKALFSTLFEHVKDDAIRLN